MSGTRLLVTGAGRCGTWWLVHALRACGVDAQHEVAFDVERHGEGDWTCEVSWLAAPFTPVADAYTVHLVRHPLAQIRSRAAWGSFEPRGPGRYDPTVKGRWAMKWIPAIRDGRTPVERAAIHWVRWNLLVWGADELLRIEDVTADVVFRLARIVDPDARRPRRLRPGTVNAAPPSPPVTWADVEHVPALLDLAAQYGYAR